QFGSQSGTIATGVTTGTTWTIPLSLMNLIPNSTSGSGTVYVDTYNGQTKIGTKWCGFTATVPSSVKPTCSIQVLDATDIQEFLIVPTGAGNASEAVFTNALVHKRIKEILVARGKGCGKGDEGGWAPKISDLEAFEIVKEATDKVFDETGIEVRMGLDVASSEMWDAEKQRYVYKNAERTTEEQIAYIAELIDDYNLIYVEDPIQEEDFEGFAAITSEVKDRDTLICGDDLFVTNVERLAQGIEMNAGNCVLIKPNQIGTLTDTFETIDLAHRCGYETVMSHRSGETTDATIAHLGTAFECCFLKCGVVGGERIAKLNELIRIEEHF
ncbi:MAG TPA: DUF859 family phage minor structural protein, partial [Methanocorpusculum sp.]|nr:DUF859 family phage minor structural protein [Methanocorpusculum sp.]